MVVPQVAYAPRGASTFGDPIDPDRTEPTGHFHRLAAGTVLPEGLEVIADGRDVLPGSLHPRTHHTIYPTVPMTFDRFVELYLDLPWQHAGKRR